MHYTAYNSQCEMRQVCHMYTRTGSSQESSAVGPDRVARWAVWTSNHLSLVWYNAEIATHVHTDTDGRR